MPVDAGHVGRRQVTRPLPAADPVDREISCHSYHPRLGVLGDLLPAHERAGQGLLGDVLGLAPVAEHDVGHAVRAGATSGRTRCRSRPRTPLDRRTPGAAVALTRGSNSSRCCDHHGPMSSGNDATDHSTSIGTIRGTSTSTWSESDDSPLASQVRPCSSRCCPTIRSGSPTSVVETGASPRWCSKRGRTCRKSSRSTCRLRCSRRRAAGSPTTAASASSSTTSTRTLPHSASSTSSCPASPSIISRTRKRALFAEVVRQLRPGGVFANLEVVESATPELHVAFRAAIGGGGRSDRPARRCRDAARMDARLGFAAGRLSVAVAGFAARWSAESADRRQPRRKVVE